MELRDLTGTKVNSKKLFLPDLLTPVNDGIFISAAW